MANPDRIEVTYCHDDIEYDMAHEGNDVFIYREGELVESGEWKGENIVGCPDLDDTVRTGLECELFAELWMQVSA